MVRKKTDPFWCYVEERPKDRWMCIFCRNDYSGHVMRIKAHLGQVKNRGIDICNKVDDGVREQALKALNLEPTQKQGDKVEETAQGNVAENNSSINPSWNFNDMLDLNPSMYNQNLPRDASHDVMLQSVPLSTEFQTVGTSSATLHTQFQSAVVPPDFCIQQHGGNTVMVAAWDPPIVNVQEHNEGQPAGVDVPLPSSSSNLGEHLGDLKRKVKRLRNEIEEKEDELHHRKKKVKKIENVYEIIEEEWREEKLSLQQVNQLEILIKEVEGLEIPGASTKASSSATHTNNHPPPLITTEFIGRESEMLEIWNCLVQDDILRVGIYGMGGVGKTEVAIHIYNKLLEDEGFDHVFWATIPQDFTIYEIQEVIGNAVQLDDLLMEKNEKIRAAMLHRFLISKKKSVLILDGLWRHFEFYDVGIPVKFHGLKLVITSRSLDVCRMMLCQAQIRIAPLLYFWQGKVFDLFLVKLGLETELPQELEEISKQLVSTCKGLPLYITAIAKRMRGDKDVRHWKDMLEKMKDPKERFKEMKHDVYDTLKLSYDSLDDHQLQQCLIFSAFYLSSRRGEGTRRNLVEFLIDVGFILGIDNRQKLSDKAHAILDKLESACLLDGDGCGGIEMHDSIIDMALNIQSDKVPCLGYYSIGMKDILDEELWFENSDEISLLIDGREESSNRLTKFSKISVLLSSGKMYFEKIPDRLLSLLAGLMILDLSDSKIKEIPHSVSDLISLTALVLRNCYELVQIPYVGKLTSLMKLDLYCCYSLTNIPSGLEYLVKLKYLNLCRTGIENLPRGILENFKKLQYLGIGDVKAEELVELNKLESLLCCFSSMEELSLYARNVTDAGPSKYDISVGELTYRNLRWYDNYPRAVSIGEWGDEEEESHGDSISLPKNIQCLRVDSWSNESIMLSDCAPLKDLEALEIYHCMEFAVIFGDQNEGIVLSNSNASLFPNLKKLNVASCSKLKYILGQGLESGFSCPNVRKIMITACDNLEGIIAAPSTIRRGFPNLEEISITDCENMRFLVVPEMLPWLKNLRRIHIENCNLKSLLSIEVFLNLPHLDEMDISICDGIEMIIELASPAMPLSVSATTHLVSNLTSLKIDNCNAIKRLLRHELLVHLCNLQTLEVNECDGLQELSNTQDELSRDLCTVTPLPNLKMLRLAHLPELRSIGAISIGSSIEIIEVTGVWQLKRIPLQMSQLPDGLWAPPSSLEKIIISNKDYNWWESLEWESQGVKNILQTYVQSKWFETQKETRKTRRASSGRRPRRIVR